VGWVIINTALGLKVLEDSWGDAGGGEVGGETTDRILGLLPLISSELRIIEGSGTDVDILRDILGMKSSVDTSICLAAVAGISILVPVLSRLVSGLVPILGLGDCNLVR